ncbi:hypothetical protein IE53DRAFT_204433 [Violaceomyces palustris]|uniref:Uncharacterized protein n=1 Tax=Violaceomyces palustris TaxID=1673888 RepID=A0ACD0NR24_9BASI|nr:hypothetical protein IE53DRAFT_204433 [Violaceomyces palustris]
MSPVSSTTSKTASNSLSSFFRNQNRRKFFREASTTRSSWSPDWDPEENRVGPVSSERGQLSSIPATPVKEGVEPAQESWETQNGQITVHRRLEGEERLELFQKRFLATESIENEDPHQADLAQDFDQRRVPSIRAPTRLPVMLMDCGPNVPTGSPTLFGRIGSSSTKFRTAAGPYPQPIAGAKNSPSRPSHFLAKHTRSIVPY